MNNSEV